MDPFAILGVPCAFEVDLQALEKTHRELSRALHPDRFVGAGSSERRAALSRAVEVNEAWRVLRDPIRRAEALLAARGAPIVEGGEAKVGQQFLMEMLELREELAEARQSGSLEAVARMARAIEQRARSAEQRFAASAAGGEVAPLAGLIAEMRFYRRFLDEVSAIEDQLGAQGMQPSA